MAVRPATRRRRAPAEPTAELESFWAAIALSPRDPLPKLIFADYLDGRGDPRAACLRWVVETGREPLQAIDVRVPEQLWGWCRSRNRRDTPIVMPWHLPDRLCLRLRDRPRDRRRLSVTPSSRVQVVYRMFGGDPTAAVRALCEAWARVPAGQDPLGGVKP